MIKEVDMLKRFTLLLILNCLIFFMVSIVFTILCSFNLIGQSSIVTLFIICSLFGFCGAFINLLLSKWLAKKIFKLKLISATNADNFEFSLLTKLQSLSKRARLKVCPQLAIFESHNPNAFATGPSKRHSLIALSSSLLENLSEKELDAVIAHELGHIANGDMVTMTLLQGLVNTFTLFISRVLTSLVLRTISSNKNRQGAGSNIFVYFIIRSIFDTIFMFFGALLMAAYSRSREFKADSFSSKITSNTDMIAALKRLENLNNTTPINKEHEGLAAFMIYSNKGLLSLLRSHPAISLRIERLNLLTQGARNLNSLNI